jgi:hypothetical protein
LPHPPAAASAARKMSTQPTGMGTGLNSACRACGW